MRKYKRGLALLLFTLMVTLAISPIQQLSASPRKLTMWNSETSLMITPGRYLNNLTNEMTRMVETMGNRYANTELFRLMQDIQIKYPEPRNAETEEVIMGIDSMLDGLNNWAPKDPDPEPEPPVEEAPTPPPEDGGSNETPPVDGTDGEEPPVSAPRDATLDEETMLQAFAASQFVKPLSNNLYNVLLDPVIQSASDKLIGDNGKPNPISHSPLLKKNVGGGYERALLKDIFYVNSQGESYEFFVEYIDPEDEEETKQHLKVMYGNNNSQMYLSLFAMLDDLVKKALTDRLNHPLDIDMYGNIVIDDSNHGNNVHHYMVVPAIVNPMLFNDDKMFVPTRKFTSMYQFSLQNIMNLDKEFTGSEYKERVGKKLGKQEVAIYSLDNSRINKSSLFNTRAFSEMNRDITMEASLPTSGLSGTPKGKYVSYLNLNRNHEPGSDELNNMLMFAFGSGYGVGLSNVATANGTDINNLGEIMTKGFSNNNSVMSFLPKDRVFMGKGSVAFEPTSTKVKKGILDEGDSYDFFYPNFIEMYGGKSLGSNISWSGGFSEEEYRVVRKLTEDFAQGNFNLASFTTIQTETTTSTLDNGAPSDTVNTSPEANYEGKVSNIVERMDALLGKPGTSLTAINSSRLSKEYSNINTNGSENLLFNATGVLDNPSMMALIVKYLQVTLYIASLMMIFNVLKYISKDVTEIPGYAWTTLKSIAYCLLPVMIIISTIGACNWITSRVFTSCFSYWTISELEVTHSQSDTTADLSRETDAYFKEINLLQSLSKSTVNLTKSGSEYSESVQSISQKLRRDPSFEEELAMANIDLYSDSIFYYFYDNLRFHLANYYASEISDGGSIPDWDNERGIVQTKGKLMKMFGDPSFLFGTNFEDEGLSDMTDEVQKGIRLSSLATENSVQDILGLTHLFTKDEVFGRNSYYKDIETSKWLYTMHEMQDGTPAYPRGEYNTTQLDSSSYKDGVIYGSMVYGNDENITSYSDFERSLQRVNSKFVQKIQSLTDYSGKYSDETLLVVAALEATFEFNKEMNGGSVLKTVQRLMKSINNPDFDSRSSGKLIPETYNGGSYSMDTVLKGIFFESVTSPDEYSGDIIHYIENKGGIIMQGLVIVLVFISQIAGLAKLLLFITIFLLSVFTFTLAYNMKKDFWNQAWAGLLMLVAMSILIHFAYLTGVKYVSVPTYSLMNKSIFGSLHYNLKVVALLILAILQTVASAFIFIFALSNWRDLGGAIVAESISGVMGGFAGALHLGGDIHSESLTSYVGDEYSNVDNEESKVEKASTVNTENLSTTEGDEIASQVDGDLFSYASEESSIVDNMSSETTEMQDLNIEGDILSDVEYMDNVDSNVSVESDGDSIINKSNSEGNITSSDSTNNMAGGTVESSGDSTIMTQTTSVNDVDNSSNINSAGNTTTDSSHNVNDTTSSNYSDNTNMSNSASSNNSTVNNSTVGNNTGYSSITGDEVTNDYVTKTVVNSPNNIKGSTVIDTDNNPVNSRGNSESSTEDSLFRSLEDLVTVMEDSKESESKTTNIFTEARESSDKED